MAVFVLDNHGKALMPCTEKRARLLLDRGRARVHRLMPMVIRLVDRLASSCDFQPLRLKIDPGSKTTGMALVRQTQAMDVLTGEIQQGVSVLNLMVLIHRGRQISEALTARRQTARRQTARRQMRRRRRGHLRFRAPRFLNRGGDRAGWLAPSLQHRVNTTTAWVQRIQRWAPVRAISSELVRFDMQALQDPKIDGIEYQQGTLFGYGLREYLLEKWRRQCAYCDARDLPLQIEHIRAKALGGSNRASNLTLACVCCNEKKAARSIENFLMRGKRVHGFGTGDMVRADVPKGLKTGVHTGRVAIRATGSFNIQSVKNGISSVVQGICYKHCRVVQRNDGYGYFLNSAEHPRRDQARPKATDALHPALYLPGINPGVSRAF